MLAKRIVISVVTANQLSYRFISSILRGDLDVSRYSSADPIADAAAATHVIVIDNVQLGAMVTELVRKLRARHRESYVVVIEHDDQSLDPAVLLASGVHAQVRQEHVEETLPQAIQCVVAGGIWFSRRSARSRQSGRTNADTNRPNLTPREFQVLELVSRRLSNKEIAVALDICECTVKYHISNLMGKCRVNSRLALAATGVVAALLIA